MPRTLSPTLSRARLNRTLSHHVAADFEAHGAEVVAKLRKEKPVEYFKMVMSILDEEDGDGAASGPSHLIVERRIITPEPRDG